MKPNERQQPQPLVPPSPSDLDDPRVVEAMEEYLAAVEQGRAPNRKAFLARHAEIAAALAECLDGLKALPDASSSSQASSAPLPDGISGTPLGDFRIIREVGRGGMGVVYEAEQLSLGRRVALKVLPFAAALDAKQLQRFKNEAQAAAHLHHPHIVPVYGVGVERGVHYYAMQLIEGQNLAALVAELRGATGLREPSGPKARTYEVTTGPYNAMSSPDESSPVHSRTVLGTQLSTLRSDRVVDFCRTVARLVAQAAEALDYAHEQGVVHRDIKPANLLVDHRGCVWITDFGLAQFHNEASLTQTGDLIGTLRYMSPEQAGGRRGIVDHRTDVYSLGATLYELLTLRPIFDGGDRQTLYQQITNDEPRPPRSVDRTIPAELETVVLKAVAKSPADRYATARDFAEDLHRFLRHEPILARRATPVQRVRKWMRRHPAVPVTAAVLMVLLTAGSLVAAWLIRGAHENTERAYVQLKQEQEKVERAYEREQQRAEEAEKRFQLAQASADEMIEVSEEELIDNPFMVGLRKRLLESALDFYQELVAQRRDDPAAQKELEVTRKRVQQILDDLAVLERSSRVDILKMPDVQKDLKLTEEQRKKLDDLFRRVEEQARDDFREFGKLTPSERRQRFLDVARAKDAGVMQFLSMQQFVRFRQLALQAMGLVAFHDPDIVAALKLTAEQKERLRALEAEARPLGPDRKQTGPGKPPAPESPSPEAKFQSLLTAEQTRVWKEMTGEPFKGSLRPPQSGRPIGPRP